MKNTSDLSHVRQTFRPFEFERALWQQNLARVAGMDEAGRGQIRVCFSAAWKLWSKA
jgi:hypothetical protein